MKFHRAFFEGEPVLSTWIFYFLSQNAEWYEITEGTEKKVSIFCFNFLRFNVVCDGFILFEIDN